MTGEDETNPNARESEDVTPAEAAMLAGLIASPSLYDQWRTRATRPSGATSCSPGCATKA